MEQVFFCILATVILAFGFIIFLLMGIRKRRVRLVYLSVLLLLGSFFSGGWAVYLFTTKTYNKFSNIDIPDLFRGRTGGEAYAAFFGQPSDSCVKVLNHVDPVLPQIDYCTWLEFRTCPAELRKILTLDPYLPVEHDGSDSSLGPNLNAQPHWFKPRLLGDSVIFLHHTDPQHPSLRTYLYISKDSTRAFYCHAAD
jgi:hypothetical protein